MKITKQWSHTRLYFTKTLYIIICIIGSVNHTFAIDAYAQSTTFTVSMNNRSVKEVFTYIEENSEFLFVYDDLNRDLNRKVNIQVKDQPVEKILNKLLEGTDTEYIIKDRQIIVRKTETPKKTNTPSPLQSVTITVTGNITDGTNEPLTGVNIMIQGTNQGVVTDIDGNFILSDIDPNATLIVSYVGYLTQTIPVNNRTHIRIILLENNALLDEVVIVGYGTQKKVNLSGAVSQISSKTLENRPIANIGSGLQGAIPNLNITINSGQATEAPTFNVRGMTSINGGSPLILVDNIPTTEAELARLNPNDIESISVLKDAASAAIYGARASYGVVLVTTKSAKSDKVQVAVNSYYTARSLGRQPKVVTNPYTVANYRDVMGAPWYDLYTDEELEYARQVSTGQAPAIRLNPNDSRYYQYYGSTNWYDEIYKSSSPSYTVNFSVAQRTNKINYYISGEYYGQDGMLRYGNDTYDRYNLRSKVDINITDWLKITNNTSYTNTTYDEPVWGGWDYFHQVNRTPTLSVPRNPDGSWTSDGAYMLGRLEEGGRTDTRTSTFNTSFGIEIDLIKDVLTLRGDASFVRTSKDKNSWDTPITYYDGPEEYYTTGTSITYARKDNEHDRYNVFNAVAEFRKTFGDHYVQVLGGFNQESRYYNSWWARRNELISISTPEINLATGDQQMGNSTQSWALRGVFFRANYIFKERYILETNGRYDGTSRFPKK